MPAVEDDFRNDGRHSEKNYPPYKIITIKLSFTPQVVTQRPLFSGLFLLFILVQMKFFSVAS
jgi:hypothetical protein